MKKDIFTKSDTFKEEYCCSIVKIGEVTPIEGSDFLGSTLVNGLTMVVRKDEIKTGDICFYAANETELNNDFLGKNNLFARDCYEKNSNSDLTYAVLNWLDTHRDPKNEDEANEIKAKEDELKTLCGFFNKYGRVKMLRLRGVPSYGILFKLDSIKKWKDIDVTEDDLESLIGTDLDTIDGELFIKAYVPRTKTVNHNGSRMGSNKRNNKLKRFDKLIPGTFKFHYDTNPLAKNIHVLRPDMSVSITCKLHGTSAIFSNVLTNQPTNFFKRIINRICGKPKFDQKYDLIYSSRSVIKNEYVNKSVNGGYYNVDIWGLVAEVMRPFIPNDMKVYGEIVGYTPTGGYIQKDYDYNCQPGSWKFMPYRIVTDHEWNVRDVADWTNKIIEDNPDTKNWLQPISILYDGIIGDRYPNIAYDEDWNANVLKEMKHDFGMEKREPMCKNKVPREGIVLRINDDTIAEAWKLKADAFMSREANMIDEGEVDIEMDNTEY